MRVLLVSWEYPPVLEGGLGRHVHRLSLALAELGHEVHVLTRGDAPTPLSGAGDVRVHRVDIPAFSAELDAFMVWVQSLNALLAERGTELLETLEIDLVHSHDWMVADAAESLAAAARAPWLVTVHATEFGRHGGWVHTHPQYEIHMAERHMVRHADAVICCSHYMAGHVERVFGLARDSVAAIPNGIDGGELATAPDSQRGERRDPQLDTVGAHHGAPCAPLVLLVGRLVHEKGFHLALEALAELPGVRWVCAGTGTAESDLHAQARGLGLLGRGRFLGRVDDALLQDLYRNADVTVVPSLYEPFGIVPLEAMAAGCPVVVADTGGLREVVTDSGAGARFTPGDAGELASTLRAVLGDPGRRAVMAAAGPPAAARFNWASVAARTAAVYEGVSAAVPSATSPRHPGEAVGA